MRTPARISVQSRECSPRLLERLTGATLFPERSVGPAIVHTVCRAGGHLLYVTAPEMVEGDAQVDYYLGLLSGDPDARHSADRARVRLVGLDDRSPRWLSEKILDPDHAEAAQVRAALRAFADHHGRNGADVRLSYFEPSEPLERLARELGVPGDQPPASCIPLGAKDAGRGLLRAAGIEVPAGSGLCHSLPELAGEIARLLRGGYRRFVLKLNSTAYGGGLGNALLDLGDLGDGGGTAGCVLDRLPGARLVDTKITWADFASAVERSGVIAEELIEAGTLRSPSFQGWIDEDGTVAAVSTHDQVLTASGQTFTGCPFPPAPTTGRPSSTRACAPAGRCASGA